MAAAPVMRVTKVGARNLSSKARPCSHHGTPPGAPCPEHPGPEQPHPAQINPAPLPHLSAPPSSSCPSDSGPPSSSGASSSTPSPSLSSGPACRAWSEGPRFRDQSQPSLSPQPPATCVSFLAGSREVALGNLCPVSAHSCPVPRSCPGQPPLLVLRTSSGQRACPLPSEHQQGIPEKGQSWGPWGSTPRRAGGPGLLV